MKLLTSFSLHCVLAVSSLPKAIATNNPYVTNPYQSVGDGPRCVTDFQEGAKVDYFPVKVDASDLGAESWQVRYPSEGNWKLVWIQNPDQPDTTNEFYVATQCGTPAPTLEEVKEELTIWEASVSDSWSDKVDPTTLTVPEFGVTTENETKVTYVDIPIETVAVTSTTQIPYINQLNHGLGIKAICGSCLYVSDQCLIDRTVEAETIYSETNPFVCTGWGDCNLFETPLNDTGVLPLDAVFSGTYFEYNTTISGGWGLGTPIHATEAWENTVIGQSGMIGYFSLYYNAEGIANALFDDAKENIDCISSNAEVYDNMMESIPVVAWSNYYAWQCNSSLPLSAEGNTCGGWSIPECQNYHQESIKMAGGEMLCTDIPYTYLNTDEFVNYTKNADILIYADGTSWGAVSAEFSSSLNQLKSVKNKKVFDTALHGLNSYFEDRMANGDGLVSDLTGIICDGYIAEQQKEARIFLRNVFEQVDGQPYPCNDPLETKPWQSLVAQCVYLDTYSTQPTSGGALAKMSLLLGGFASVIGVALL